MLALTPNAPWLLGVLALQCGVVLVTGVVALFAGDLDHRRRASVAGFVAALTLFLISFIILRHHVSHWVHFRQALPMLVAYGIMWRVWAAARLT